MADLLSIHARRRVLYIKKEPTPGTYVSSTTLFAVGNAVIPPESIKYAPERDMVERNLDGNSLQQPKGITGAQKAPISFTSLLIGPASKGVAGPLSDLFLASGESETMVAGTSATFAENPNSQTRLSVGVGMIREDGNLEVEYAIAGAGVDYTIKGAKIGAPLMVDWKIMGKVAYESGSIVALDDNTPNTGITFVNDDAQGFKFMGLSVVSGLLSRQINNFEFARGASWELGTDTIDLAGYNTAKFVKSAPTVKIDPSKVAVATANDVQSFLQGAQASAGFTVTNAAGAKFSMAFPNLQITSLSDDARGAVSTWGITAACRRSLTGSATDASDAYTKVFG